MAARPKPEDTSLLVHYAQHRTHYLTEADPYKEVRIARCDGELFEKPEHPLVQDALLRAGFYGCYAAGWHEIYLALLTAMVERWRSETHTFHLPVGEATITLQDVAVFWGLPVYGEVVPSLETAKLSVTEWQQLFRDICGIEVDSTFIKESTNRVMLAELKRIFVRTQPQNPSIEEAVQRACLWIFLFINCHLFSDTSGNLGNLNWLFRLQKFELVKSFNWGAAALSYLYNQLCRACKADRVYVCGGVSLIQLWVWDRFVCFKPTLLAPTQKHIQSRTHDAEINWDSPGKPRGAMYNVPKDFRGVVTGTLVVYRDVIDKLQPSQFTWQPYDGELEKLPTYCREGCDWWRAKVPLIYGHIVEWHRPDRVMRQFGMRQSIPDPPYPLTSQRHLKGIEVVNEDDIQVLKQRWVDSERVTILGEMEAVPDPVALQEYMQWYHRHTIIQVGHPSWLPKQEGCIGTAQDARHLATTIQHVYHHLRRASKQYTDGTLSYEHFWLEMDVVMDHIRQALQETSSHKDLLDMPAYYEVPIRLPQQQQQQSTQPPQQTPMWTQSVHQTPMWTQLPQQMPIWIQHMASWAPQSPQQTSQQHQGTGGASGYMQFTPLGQGILTIGTLPFAPQQMAIESPRIQMPPSTGMLTRFTVGQQPNAQTQQSQAQQPSQLQQKRATKRPPRPLRKQPSRGKKR